MKLLKYVSLYLGEVERFEDVEFYGGGIFFGSGSFNFLTSVKPYSGACNDSTLTYSCFQNKSKLVYDIRTDSAFCGKVYRFLLAMLNR